MVNNKTMSNSQSSLIAARTLKLVGVILILSFLLDFLILSFPLKILDRAWQITFATQLVDRGIIPMVGLALITAGYWIDNANDFSTNRQSWLDLRFWALLFSSLLGLLFLVLFPIHLNNVRQASAQTIQQINQDANQAETQLQAQLGSPQAQEQLAAQQTQVKSQINELLKNDQQLNQVLQSDRVPEQLKALLRQSKANPKAVDEIVQQQLSPEALRNQGLTRIRRRKAEAEQQATAEAWKSGLRTGISSLLLSIGYIVIGWTGLKSFSLQPGRRKTSAR